MARIIALTLLAATIAAGDALAAVACTGADPAIVSIAVGNVSQVNGKNRYTIRGTVLNKGSAGQASNVLQFVDISQNGVKLDAKSIPPLRPGQSFTFSYVTTRSSDAGNGTSKLAFKLDMHQPTSPGAQNCSTSNDTYVLTF